MYCIKCGTYVPAKFCPRCGTVVSNIMESSIKAGTKVNTNKFLKNFFLIFAIVFTIALGMAIFIAVPKEGASSPQKLVEKLIKAGLENEESDYKKLMSSKLNYDFYNMSDTFHKFVSELNEEIIDIRILGAGEINYLDNSELKYVSEDLGYPIDDYCEIVTYVSVKSRYDGYFTDDIYVEAAKIRGRWYLVEWKFF